MQLLYLSTIAVAIVYLRQWFAYVEKFGSCGIMYDAATPLSTQLPLNEASLGTPIERYEKLIYSYLLYYIKIIDMFLYCNAELHTIADIMRVHRSSRVCSGYF